MALLKILGLSDVHGNIKAVNKLINYINKKDLLIDYIVITGDLPSTTPLPLMLRYMLSNPFSSLSKTSYTKWVYKNKGRSKFVGYQKKSINKILSVLESLNIPIIYIPGNVDTNEVQELINNWPNSQIFFLDCNFKQFNSIIFYGCGGALFYSKINHVSICDMEFSPDEFKMRFKYLFENRPNQTEKKISVLLTHEPPAFTYQKSSVLMKGGSQVVKNLITDLKPQIAIFGHYHEFSMVKKLMNTLYINPGPLACYRFAIIDIYNNEIQVNLNKLPASKFDTTNIIYHYRLDHNYNIRFD